MNIKNSFLTIAFIMYSCALFALSACSSSPQIFLLTGKTMGTTYTVKINAKSLNKVMIHQEIEKVLQRVNHLMSTYDPSSEISTFNKSNDTPWFKFSEETMQVILAAKNISALSDGAFDITVGPLVNLWGFGPEARPEEVPSDDLINKTRGIIGIDLLEINPATNEARKKDGAMKIDLSAIAKGYGVDAVSELLHSYNLNSHMVEIGGEVIAKGTRPDGAPWRIAIEKPDDLTRQIKLIIPLNDLAVASSGTYRNYFEKDGIRYSHTISPHTGKPITHKLVSVSVLSQTCMNADAWATALMVLGPEKGFQIAAENNLAALFISKSKDGFPERSTDKWNSLSH